MFLSARALPRVQSNYLQTASSTRPNSAYRSLNIATDKMTVQRITIFKVTSEADIPQFFEKYQTLKQDQKKVHRI